MAGSGFQCKEGRDGGIDREKWAGKRDLRTLLWNLLKYISDDCQSQWKTFYNFYLSKFGGKLVFTSNLARKDTKSLDVKDTFLQELIGLWSDLNYRDFTSEFWCRIHMEQLND